MREGKKTGLKLRRRKVHARFEAGVEEPAKRRAIALLRGGEIADRFA